MDQGKRNGSTPVRRAVILACLVLATAACSGQGNPVSSAGSITGSSAKAIDMCSLVTKADVAAAFGGDVGTGTPDSGTTCSFEIGGTAKAGKPLPGFNVPKVIVSLTPGQWLSAADQQKLFPSDKITPVSGLGEDAWYWARGLNVKRGTDLFSIYLSTDFATYDAAELAADSIALAKIGYPRL
jgi:hypothetical protein